MEEVIPERLLVPATGYGECAELNRVSRHGLLALLRHRQGSCHLNSEPNDQRPCAAPPRIPQKMACSPSHIAVPHYLAFPTKSVMTYATLDSSVGKQEGWRVNISEHWDRNDRQDLGSPVYGASGLNRGSAWWGTATSEPGAVVEARSVDGLTCSWSSRSTSWLSWSETSA